MGEVRKLQHFRRGILGKGQRRRDGVELGKSHRTYVLCCIKS